MPQDTYVPLDTNHDSVSNVHKANRIPRDTNQATRTSHSSHSTTARLSTRFFDMIDQGKVKDTKVNQDKVR